MRNKKRKKKNGNSVFAVILIICSAALGYFMASLGLFDFADEAGLFEFIVYFIFQMLLFYVSYLLQLIIHEAGHLIAGLMTGYGFSSFRIGSLMLLKNKDGFSFKKFSLAGTGGQCLLIPPEKKQDGTYPYLLYHLGGVLLNLITSILFFLIYSFISGRTFFLFLVISGIICTVTNGIPMRISGLATDGYNVIHIGKEPFALEAMWLQLKINEAQTNGIRLKDMPKEWFETLDNAEKTNEIISCISVFGENRAMDMLDFRKAEEIISLLTESGEYSIIGLYKNLLVLDKITIELIKKRSDADISAFYDRETKAFRKAMGKYPAVIRTEYAVELLYNNDAAGAEKYLEKFNSIAKKYPAKADIDSEAEIISYIKQLNT